MRQMAYPRYNTITVGPESIVVLATVIACSMNRRSRILALAVIAIGVCAGLTIWWLGQGHRPPNLLPLADIDSFPASCRAAVAATIEDLDRSGEQPKEFYARVEEGRDDKIIVLHLWHESAFASKYKYTVGNPGGKCRDVWFDPAKGQIIRVGIWQ